MASGDGCQQEPGGSQLAVPDGPQLPGGGQQMPEHHTIGTKQAFENNYVIVVYSASLFLSENTNRSDMNFAIFALFLIQEDQNILDRSKILLMKLKC